MLQVNLTGDWTKTLKQLAWMRKHWAKIARVTVRRAVISLADEAGVAEPRIRFVKVTRKGGREMSYGVAIEPELEEVALERLRGRVVLYELERRASTEALEHLASHGAWVAQALPQLPSKEQGHLVVRDAVIEEQEEVLRRNRRFLRDHPLLMAPHQRGLLRSLSLEDPMRPMLLDASSRVMAEEDHAYNLTRAEFGLGDKLTAMVWRPALARLIRQRLDLLLEDVVEDLSRGKLDVLDQEDRFESRSETWLTSTRAFALMFNEDTDERQR
jgi:hypothetical protein